MEDREEGELILLTRNKLVVLAHLARLTVSERRQRDHSTTAVIDIHHLVLVNHCKKSEERKEEEEEEEVKQC